MPPRFRPLLSIPNVERKGLAVIELRSYPRAKSKPRNLALGANLVKDWKPCQRIVKTP
jgi:hypothetical protein